MRCCTRAFHPCNATHPDALSPSISPHAHARYIEDVLVAFRTRHDLHKTVYQHKAVKSVEYILCDALDAAHKGGLKIRGTDGRMVTMVEAVRFVLNRPPPCFAGCIRCGVRGDRIAVAMPTLDP